jgi:peptide/nickel transport system ATP-binding protein
MSDLLTVRNVMVELKTRRGTLRAVDGVDLTLPPGRTLGIVGESGCGKTMLSRAVLQLLPRYARLTGEVLFDGQDLTRLTPKELRRLRGRSIAVVFQDPMTSLNPVLTIGQQIIETLREHLAMDGAAAVKRAVALIAAVGIPEPERRLRQYPHQLSGGMRQRVAIAIALSCEPQLLIADELTTALDVTVQAQILDLLAREQRRRHMAMIIITHDLGIVAGRTDEVAVMYAGRVVERAPTARLFRHMRMPYTQALLAAIPKVDAAPHSRLPTIPGRPPDMLSRSAGCAFAPRCSLADARCRREVPPLAAPDAAGQQYACWRPLEHRPVHVGEAAPAEPFSGASFGAASR